MIESDDFPESTFHTALSIAVRVALSHGEAPPFLDWMKKYGATLFVEALGAPDLPAEGRAPFGMALGRAIWNHLPLPDNGFQPRKLPEPSRNDPCPCGSGQKYKLCCAVLEVEIPALGTEELLPFVLELMTKKDLASLPDKRFAPELLAGIASQWARKGNSTRATALLEPLFADPARLDERHAPAFDVLMNIYLKEHRPRKRKQLLESCLASHSAHLRGAALQRQCTMAFDSGDHEEAWKLFHRALREDPDDPSMGVLELTLLQGEGKPALLRERARFWAARLQRRRDADDLADIIQMMKNAAEDPVTLAESFVAGTAPEFEALAKALSRLPPVAKVPALEVLDDGHGIWPENRAAWLEEWFEREGGLEEDVAWLVRHPKAWDDVEVLGSLLSDAFESSIPLAWLDRAIIGPIVERGRALFDASLGSAPRAPEKLEWGWHPNRPVMRLLADRIHWLERQGRHEDAIAACAELLRLNPGDNQGIREVYSGILLGRGRYHEVAELCARYPDDFCWLRYDRPLALFALDRKGEALTALDSASKAFPKVIKMLAAASPREPKQGKYGVVVGGDYEAWLYCQARLPLWTETGAIEMARQYVGAKRPARKR